MTCRFDKRHALIGIVCWSVSYTHDEKCSHGIPWLWERHSSMLEYDILLVQDNRGAIGVDGVQLGQIASRGAGGLVNTGKKTNAKNNFATARNASCVLA